MVTLLSRDALAVKVLEQRNCVLAGQPGEFFESGNFHKAAPKRSEPAGQLLECVRMNEQVIAAHAHNGLIALQRRYQAAHICPFQVESERQFGDGRRGKASGLVCLSKRCQPFGFYVGRPQSGAEELDCLSAYLNLLPVCQTAHHEVENLLTKGQLAAQLGRLQGLTTLEK